MMKFYFLGLTFLFVVANPLFSQDSIVKRACDFNMIQVKRANALTLQSAYGKTGLYAGLAWNSNFHEGWNVNLLLSTKIRHLGFNTFSPLVSMGLGYDVLKENWKVDLVPGLKGQLVTSRLSEASTVNNIEMLFGYEFVLGDRYKLVHGAYYGLGYEGSKKYSVNYSSFLIHIGFGYVFSH